MTYHKIIQSRFNVSLKAIIRNQQNQLLVLKTISANPRFHDTLDLPGGSINNDEINTDFHKIIRREITEECGSLKYRLRLDPVALSKYRFNNEHERLYILFEARFQSGKIKISEEHSDYSWVPLDRKIFKLNFQPSLKQLIKNYVKWNNLKL
ncbi:MAG: NUDIX domain-containing protein [Patescibacteria group bacterium]|jgi:8-oxo-dGTP pyrophosphatase MutT (NUDIX family)